MMSKAIDSRRQTLDGLHRTLRNRGADVANERVWNADWSRRPFTQA
jgi:hypothetical protein